MRIVVVLPLFCLLIQQCNSDGFADQVFRRIRVNEGSACWRLLNGTHSFGCHANDDNQHGIVVRIDEMDDFQSLQTCYRSIYPEYDGKFWILMPLTLMKKEAVSFIRSSNCISGLVLYNTTDKMAIEDDMNLSHESECPNENFNFYTKTGKSEYCSEKINAKAAVLPEGVLKVDWGIQMVYIMNSTDLEVLKKCHSMFNTPKNTQTTVTYPYCGMTFKLSNIAAGNSEICYRRGLESSKLIQLNIDDPIPTQFCSPLSGYNVFSWPTPVVATDNMTIDPKYMMIATRMDGFGLLPEIAPSEISVLTSLIAQIVAARSVGLEIEKWTEASSKTNKHLIFATFNGESFDYIGSSATVHRMRNHEFPLKNEHNYTKILRNVNIDQLDYIVEPQQIGTSENGQYYVHLDGERYDKRRVPDDLMVSEIETSFERFGMKAMRRNERTPPSSWHSFALYDNLVQSLIIAPYDKEYKYNRYNSMLDINKWDDKSRNKVIDEIEAVATTILAVGAKYVGIENSTNVAKIDKELIRTLFKCFITSDRWFECDFLVKLNGGKFETASHSYLLTSKSTYVSVSSHNPLQFIIKWLHVFALGSDKETLNVKNEKSCEHLREFQGVYAYEWQPSPYTGQFSCLRSSMNFIEMTSPAFEIDGYSISKNTTYSTWTEAIYTIDNVKLYLMEDQTFDKIMILLAAISVIFSMFIVGRCTESTFIVDEGEPAAEGGEPL